MLFFSAMTALTAMALFLTTTVQNGTSHRHTTTCAMAASYCQSIGACIIVEEEKEPAS